MWTCTLYLKTGFGGVNIPDRPSLLNSGLFDTFEAPPLDIIQPYNLSTLTVRVPYTYDSAIKNADYLRLSRPGDTPTAASDGWYYFISGFEYTSSDVVRLDLVPDFLTTAGGPIGMIFLDGDVERAHVSSSEDTWGAFPEPDDLLAPAHRMIPAGTWAFGKSEPSTVLCESTIDLVAMSSGSQAKVYTQTGGTSSVTVPVVTPVAGPTTVILRDGYGESRPYPTTGTRLFVVKKGTAKGPGSETYTTYPKVTQGQMACRAIGVERGVIGQWEVPNSCLGVSNDSDGSVTELRSWCQSSRLDNSEVVDHTIPELRLSPWQKYEEGGTGLRNLRLAYSEYMSYHLLTAGGDSAVIAPYDIVEGPNTEGSYQLYPHLTRNTDPRLGGKPYFRFSYYRHLRSLDPYQPPFFIDSVAGMPWRTAPLTYAEKSGSWMDRQKIESYLQRQNADYARAQVSAAYAPIRSLMGAGSGLGLGAYAGAEHRAAPLVESALSLVGGFVDAYKAKAWDLPALKEQYQLARNEELRAFGAATKIVAPDLAFPLDPSMVRDVYGNGCYVWRNVYSELDRLRIDRLLTMYGYLRHDTLAAASRSFFTNRGLFNYVQARGAQVGSDTIPRFMREGIAAQLEGGVRVWHVKPDLTAYSYNPPA